MEEDFTPVIAICPVCKGRVLAIDKYTVIDGKTYHAHHAPPPVTKPNPYPLRLRPSKSKGQSNV